MCQCDIDIMNSSIGSVISDAFQEGVQEAFAWRPLATAVSVPIHLLISISMVCPLLIHEFGVF